MLIPARPDTTNEGWNTWPTEKVSHALVKDRAAHARVREHTTQLLSQAPADLAALSLASLIRGVVESALEEDGAEQLRESLVAFALSRVDWLQLAQAELDTAIAQDTEVASVELLATG
jgi:hypothetical protein